MSRRHENPVRPSSRLEEVLAAGLRQASLQASTAARAKQLEKKTLIPAKQPPKGITKPPSLIKGDPELREALKRIARERVTLEDEANVVMECFDFVDRFGPFDNSTESEAAMVVVSTLRYFEHLGLVDEDYAAGTYDAISIFLAVRFSGGSNTDVEPDQEPTPMATGVSLFSEEQRGQEQRKLFKDKDFSTLFMNYLSSLEIFNLNVYNQDWKKSGFAILNVFLIVMELLGLLSSYAPKDFNLTTEIVQDLNSRFNANSEAGSLLTGEASRTKWARLAIEAQRVEMSQNAVRSLFNIKDRMKNGFLAIFGANGNSAADPNLKYVYFLQKVWGLGMTVDPMARIGLHLAMVAVRGYLQARKYRLENIEQYAKLNSPMEAKLWRDELIAATNKKAGLSDDQKKQRIAEAEESAKKWESKHKELSELLKKRPVFKVDFYRLVYGRNWQTFKEVMRGVKESLQYDSWREEALKQISAINAEIEAMDDLQGKYTDNDITEAKKTVQEAREAAADAAAAADFANAANRRRRGGNRRGGAGGNRNAGGGGPARPRVQDDGGGGDRVQELESDDSDDND